MMLVYLRLSKVRSGLEDGILNPRILGVIAQRDGRAAREMAEAGTSEIQTGATGMVDDLSMEEQLHKRISGTSCWILDLSLLSVSSLLY